MKLDKLVVVAGMPGVHKIVASRQNGFIIEDKHENRTRFVPMRQSQLTLLGTVGIYVEGDQDTLPLGDVWQRMYEQVDTVQRPPQTANSAEFRAYFDQVLPEHDPYRVHINDIKKCLKWFGFAYEKGMLAEIIEQEKTEATANESEAPAPEETPADEAKAEN